VRPGMRRERTGESQRALCGVVERNVIHGFFHTYCATFSFTSKTARQSGRGRLTRPVPRIDSSEVLLIYS